MKTQNQIKRRPLLVKIGICSLNNDPIRFDRNYEHIMKSIQICKEKGCKIRVGGELQIPGYACNEHYNQYDTTVHSWEIIAKIIKSGITQDIVCNLGTVVIHHGNLYNTQVVVFNSKIVAIRPKLNMADGDSYFETKWFGAWKSRQKVAEFKLPKIIQQITGQIMCPIGEFILDLNDTMISYEICEEGWVSNNPMIDSTLSGAEIVINPSASYVERGKLLRKIQMLKQCTQKHGGAYCYANVIGAVGQRSYFDGGCIFTENGKVRSVTKLNTMDNVIVTEAIANLTAIRTFRLSKKSFGKGSYGVDRIPKIRIDFNVADCRDKHIVDCPQQLDRIQRLLQDYYYPSARWQPSLFLWDYLRKSKGSGFFLALSGGLDSCSVALIVYNMCYLLWNQINSRKNLQVLQQLRIIVDNQGYQPTSAKQICSKLLFTAYMSNQNSSQETKNRAQLISKTLNCNHRCFGFDQIYKATQQVGKKSLGMDINFMQNGGSWRQDLALQNIQARSRMILSYMFAQLELEIPKRKGFLLVLGSGNLDECLRGYFTKYDCSSADINPIGSFSKHRLRQFLQWNQAEHHFQFIDDILQASPSAELQPLAEGKIAQTDEQDMGLTYEQLYRFGKLRRIDKFGPVSMFQALYQSEAYDNIEFMAERVKKFFKFYAMNRHKMTVLTPSFHYDPESCDDNRYDMRPVFYATDWKYQFQIIDERVEEIMGKQKVSQ